MPDYSVDQELVQFGEGSLTFLEPRFWRATANGLSSTIILLRNIVSRRFQAFSFGI